MNLDNEQTWQMCQEILDAIGLTVENRRLANEYLDIERFEDRDLLEKAIPQDLSQLAPETLSKSLDYLRHHLKERNLEEDFKRYVRFMAAVGGSTACHVLYGSGASRLETLPGLNVEKYLTKEQGVAIQAEMTVRGPYSLNWNYNGINTLVQMGRKKPLIYCKAIDLCYGSSDNARILLAGLYLRFAEKKDSDHISKMTNFLVDHLISTTVSKMIVNKSPLKEQKQKELTDFFYNADPYTDFTGQAPPILRGSVAFPDNLSSLLPGAAFLAIEHSDRFLLFVRFMMDQDEQAALSACRDICGKEWMAGRMVLLERVLPGKPEEYVSWCAKNQFAQPIKRLAVSEPESIKRALSSLTAEGYLFLVSQVQEVNPSLGQTLGGRHDKFRSRMAEELTERYQVGKAEATDYLTGRAELEKLCPFMEEWRKNSLNYHYFRPENYRKMIRMRDQGDAAMFCRALVLEAVACRPNFFVYHTVYAAGPKASEGGRRTPVYGNENPVDQKQLQAMLNIFEQEGLSAVSQLALLDAIYHNYDWYEEPQNRFLKECVNTLAFKRSDWEKELTEQAVNGSMAVRLICILVLDMYWSEYKEVLLSCAADTSKPVRRTLASVYESHREWEQDICAMLYSKKVQAREMAVETLEKWGASSYEKELTEAFEAEKSKKIKDKIRNLLNKNTEGKDPAQPMPGDIEDLEQLTAELLKGSRRRKVEWACEAMQTPVHKTDGTECSQDHLLAILMSYADMSAPGRNRDAARLAAEADSSELADFMERVFQKWLFVGADAKKKWVIYAVSVHGDESIVPILHQQILLWSKTGRAAMAGEGLRALALNGSSSALLLVDQVSRKVKNYRLKTAAREAFTYAAEQMGITGEELEDRIVPRLGFDEKMERLFDYGTRSFRVSLTPAMKPEIYDENGKKLKNMPSPGKRDDQEKAKAASEAFQQMKKQLKTVAENQKLRLEHTLCTGRLWQADKWLELFVKNPVMHQFAVGLIWGVYEQSTPDANEKVSNILTATFRYMEDGSFNTADEEEYALPENGMIGLVHPVEMSEEVLSTWKKQLSDYEVVQPFDQLARPVYRVTQEEMQEKELGRFNGTALSGRVLFGKLLDQGWLRGAAQNGSVFRTFYRCDGTNGAELEFSGAVTIGEEKDVTVYDVGFYSDEEEAQGGWRCQNDYRQKRCPLQSVSPRYFSEIVLQVSASTC